MFTFDNGNEQPIDDQILIPINTNKKSDLIPFDTVLVRQKDVEYWLPGIVLSLPISSDSRTNTYKIRTYDPNEDEVDIYQLNNIRFERSEIIL